jgi:arylsulfatase A-like enzyme
MRRACKHVVLVALVSLFVGLGVTGSYQEGRLAQTAAPKPNIIFIITDDMRKDDLNARYMPKTTTQLVAKGMSFQNAFVSNPICCPSRSTIMRGQYAHNTKVWFTKNVFDPDPNVRDGGWAGYKGNGYEDDNVATRLKAAGYTTGLFGKYQNGYDGTTVPPKWDDWFAFTQLRYYNYDVNDNGTIKHFGTSQSAYSTDVLNSQVQEFIGANAAQASRLSSPTSRPKPRTARPPLPLATSTPSMA